jgi:hypothetical protein
LKLDSKANAKFNAVSATGVKRILTFTCRTEGLDRVVVELHLAVAKNLAHKPSSKNLAHK